MKRIITFIFTLSIALVSCKKNPKTDNSNPPLIELGPSTLIIDNATAQTIQSIDSTHIIFDGNTEQLQRLASGNIIVSAAMSNAPSGFLRKISNIVKNGTLFTLLTTEAPLTEAFKNLHIDFTTPTSSFTIAPPDVILYDVDGNNGTTNDQVKVKVNSGLSPKFHIKVDITNFNLDYAKIDGNFEGTLSTSITAGGSIGSVSKEINIYSQPIGVFTIPGTPIVIVASLRVSLGASGSINIEVVASDNKTSNINTFIEYQNGNWDKGFTRTMENQFTFSGLVGNANAKVYIEPAIDFKLWGSNWAKGSIISQGYLKASGQILPTPDCELKAGISAGAEANLKFFGWTFTAASYPDIFDYSKILYTCSVPNTQLPTLSTSPISVITNNAATSGGNVTSSGASAVSARGICWATSPHPTIANNITTNGSGTGNFASSLSGLSPSTTYYVRAYASNTQGTNYGNEIIFTTQPNSGTVTDIDGNIYTTAIIGTQVWLVQNLKTTRYRNGDPIPHITDNAQWNSSTTGAYSNYNNDQTTASTYGRLYNYYSISDTRNLAPVGWHIPTKDEISTLHNFLGGLGDTTVGGKMKELGTSHWLNGNPGATNSSGFTGLPSGERAWHPSGTSLFSGIGAQGIWWSSSLNPQDPMQAYYYHLTNHISVPSCGNCLLTGFAQNPNGFAVRCIKD